MQVYSALKDFLWSPVASTTDDSQERLFSCAKELQQQLQSEAEKKHMLTETLQQQTQQYRTMMQEEPLKLMLDACQNYRSTQQQIELLLLQQQLTQLRHRLGQPGVDETMIIMLDTCLTTLQRQAGVAGRMKQAGLDVLPHATLDGYVHGLSQEVYALFDKHVGTSFAEDPKALAEISTEAGMRIEALIKLLQLSARLTAGNDDGPRFARKIADCLSPFVGKFHFHLSVNSSDEMAARINWVFDYTETFLRFITQVWRAICPAEGSIHLADNSSIYEVTLRMLYQKIMGLVRIQVANILEELLETHKHAAAGTPPPAGFMEVVERSLSVDKYVQYLLSSGPLADIMRPLNELSHAMASRVVDVPNSVSCSVVVCEATDAMDLFIDMDKAAISKKILHCLSSENSFSTAVRVPIGRSALQFQSPPATLACVRGLYDVLWLTRIVSARYSALPSSYRGVVVREVLQPLLWTIPAVLLWWVRSVPEGLKSQMIYIAKKGDVSGMLRLTHMVDTLHFAERALMQETTSDLGIVVNNIKSVWEYVQTHATSAATFHSQRVRHASQITARPRSAGSITSAVSTKPLGVLVRNLFEMSAQLSPAPRNNSGFTRPSSAALSPSAEGTLLPKYICTLVHALREGVIEEFKDATQQVMFEICKTNELRFVINKAYDIGGMIRDCYQLHAAAIGSAGQSAIVVTSAKVFNQAILKLLVEQVGTFNDKPLQQQAGCDVESLHGLVDILCAGKGGNVLRAEVAQALGESADAIKLLNDDWSRVSGLWNLLDLEVESSSLDSLEFGVKDREVELGDVTLESPKGTSPHAASKPSWRSSDDTSPSSLIAAQKHNLIEQMIADYHARPVTSEIGEQLPSLASDALKAYGVNFLSPRLAYAVMRCRVSPST